MDWTKAHTRRSFFWILFWLVVLCGAVYAGLWWETEEFKRQLFLSLADTGDMRVTMMNSVTDVMGEFLFILAPALVGLVVVFALLLWLTLRRSLRKWSAKAGAQAAPAKKKAKAAQEPETPKKTAGEKAEERERTTLHLFSLLQREGRLMDLLAEDLSLYEDAQIGAALRGVHENCKKLLDKRLKPVPILDQPEGESVTVDVGFDPAAIKLTGNVSGDPPFTGVLRHKGWRAAKFDMPTLITAEDPKIIAPAEVEIS